HRGWFTERSAASVARSHRGIRGPVIGSGATEPPLSRTSDQSLPDLAPCRRPASLDLAVWTKRGRGFPGWCIRADEFIQGRRGLRERRQSSDSAGRVQQSAVPEQRSEVHQSVSRDHLIYSPERSEGSSVRLT